MFFLAESVLVVDVVNFIRVSIKFLKIVVILWIKKEERFKKERGEVIV